MGIQISGTLAQRGMLAEPDLVYHQDEDFCEELNIGDNEGLSEEVVTLHYYNDPVPQGGLDCDKEDPLARFLHDDNNEEHILI